MSWRDFILAMALYTAEEIMSVGFSAYWPRVLIACSIVGRSQAPEKVTVTDLFNLRGIDVGLVNVPYLLARYLRLFTSGRKQGDMIFRAPGREGKHVASAVASKAAENAHVADKGAPAVLAPVVEEDVHEIQGALGEQRERIRQCIHEYDTTYSVD
uniref:Uncharacterized protein n=1 Tax=Tanacetum cinerariifolium TaxID=118510 RepID=A0A6L2JUU7_TANCI|nr:hypothetical protein [Tanacetum cinerariifolium]